MCIDWVILLPSSSTVFPFEWFLGGKIDFEVAFCVLLLLYASLLLGYHQGRRTPHRSLPPFQSHENYIYQSMQLNQQSAPNNVRSRVLDFTSSDEPHLGLF